MGSKQPEAPKPPPPPPPAVTEVDAQPAVEATKKRLLERKGALSTWLTRGQSLGGGTNLKG